MIRTLLWPLAAAAALAAACSSGQAAPQVASVPGAAHHAAAPQSATQLVHTAAQCIRDHGAPDFPDPVIDTHGVLQVDENALKAVPAAVASSAEQACGSRIDAAQAAVNALQPAATPQELARATALARCMRQHGWPNFPDPDAHGRFSSSAPGATPASKDDPSFQVCIHLVSPSGR